MSQKSRLTYSLSLSTAFILCLTGTAALASGEQAVSDKVIAKQRAMLAVATSGAGFGPQSPRDIDAIDGSNNRSFGEAPPHAEMTLCDIHFHENAEHKGGDFTTYAGNGDGEGNGTGFKYNGKLTAAELDPLETKVGVSEHGSLEPGDTIEIHFVFSTAKATLGNGLGTCFADAISNPQLRVEAVVAVLVNDSAAADMTELASIVEENGLNQVPNLPDNLGTPVTYAGSTTGPGFNEQASPFQVTWGVRPKTLKIDLISVDAWLAFNPFGEKHAHGVRNLVINPDLLSPLN